MLGSAWLEPHQPVPIKRPILRYCLLAFLFAITVAYEIPYLHDVLRDEGRSVPFFAMETGTDRVSTASKEATEAGIFRGDEVVSIDGQPYRGLTDWARPLADKSIGSTIAVGLRPANPSEGKERVVLLPVKATAPDPAKVAAALTLYFLLPAVCVLLGFWVAFKRPRDPMAWLLLALMLTFPHIFESYKAEAWPGGEVREADRGTDPATRVRGGRCVRGRSQAARRHDAGCVVRPPPAIAPK